MQPQKLSRNEIISKYLPKTAQLINHHDKVMDKLQTFYEAYNDPQASHHTKLNIMTEFFESELPELLKEGQADGRS